MALKLKYTDEHGILHIDMSPTSTPRVDNRIEAEAETKTEITDPKFDTINNRFGQYDLFGGKYDVESGGEAPTPCSLFRSRYNSIEEELANTPYAFATERSLRLNSASSPIVDITIKSRTVNETSPSKDIEDDRFFNRNPIDYDLFGPQIDFKSSVKTSDEEDTPAFTVTQLIHAQDRYFDLSSRHSSSVVDSPRTESVRTAKGERVKEVKSEPVSARKRTVTIVNSLKSCDDDAFRVLSSETEVTTSEEPADARLPVAQTPKKKKESSFAIITETPAASRPSSPRSLPVEIRPGRVSPFKGRGFREETSRHNTPRTSAANSRASSPPRRRTNSLSRIDKMAAATLPPPIHTLSRPHSPRNFLKENIEEVRELSELNREMHEEEAELKRRKEEEALLKEMAEFEKSGKTDAIRSVVCSRTTSRSNSPNKIKLRSRSNSPALSPAAIVRFNELSTDSTEYINANDGMSNPVTHQSRVRSVSKSQPQSNDGSPKHSKIPKRQNSVSPNRNNNKREVSNSRKPVENSLNRSQRFISNSTSSLHETVRIGSQGHDKKGISQSTQLLNIAPAHIKGKPPISPGRGGPPPSNKSINAKRLSPIVGTPNKSPIEDLKPSSAKTPTKPSPAARKPVKTAGNTPATTRLNSRQPSRQVSRDPSPDKRKTVSKPNNTTKPVNNSARSKPVTRAASTRSTIRPTIPIKPDPKKPINRTNSMKSLTRTPSARTLNDKPPLLKKRDSRMDLKATSMSKINEVSSKKDVDVNKSSKKVEKGKDSTDKGNKISKAEKEIVKEGTKTTGNMESSASAEEITTQDNETQYDKITNEKGELVILTKKNIVSMTTAAITSQPLEVVTKVTNQLPAAFEKAREKGIFERHSSRDSLAPKEDDKESTKPQGVEVEKADIKEPAKEKSEQDKNEDKKVTKPVREKSTVFAEDNVKLKPLLPPYNNPQVERAKQKIDDILKSPEVSTEHISNPPKVKETKNTFKNFADKTKKDIKEAKDETANKFANLKDQIVKQNEKTTAEIRSEATKIVDSIITPVEEPKDVEKAPEEVKKVIEPIVMVVNEKKNSPIRSEVLEKMTETLVKGEPEVEVQSSNVSSPSNEKMEVQAKLAEGSESDKSMQSNGGFPQSTSTTPKPPARTRKDQSKDSKQSSNEKETTPDSHQSEKKPNICQRLMGKCRSKCCPCCVQAEDDDETETKDVEAQEMRGGMSRLNCCRREKDEDMVSDIERAAGKAASIQIENETQRPRSLRAALCACCGRRRRVSDASELAARRVPVDGAPPPGAVDAGCCGRRRPDVERRDSILSDRAPNTCCNNRLSRWVRGACRRHHSDQLSSSRRQSLFSKNKSLSPTLPPEDTRTKLDPSLVEHTSVMRGAIPVLPIALAYFCLFCNVVVPGLGSIFSGMFCLCFGIPRFGVHDGAKYRLGSFFINLLVGCGQLFTVLFCLVGWGWSIWWGVIMVRTSRKYRKLKAEAAAEEAEAAPPVTANNHTRA